MTADRIRAYEKTTYYAGQWRPEYERWVQMLAGLATGPGRDIVARNTGLIDDMIYTQPVVYEFPLIKTPTLLLIGDKDIAIFLLVRHVVSKKAQNVASLKSRIPC